ncbi:MAG: hypothetical protein RML94_10255 [Bacteroidia bacterium]|nr:hypothetical protein [Bacteroidia bacterium]
MRHAKGVRQHGAKPLAYTFTLAQGVGGWGAAPLARSTPTPPPPPPPPRGGGGGGAPPPAAPLARSTPTRA